MAFLTFVLRIKPTDPSHDGGEQKRFSDIKVIEVFLRPHSVLQDRVSYKAKS